MPFRLFISCSTAAVLLFSTLVSGIRLSISNGPVLENGFKYCAPTGVPVVLCDPTDPADVTGVSFYVNDKNVGWVGVAPYLNYISKGVTTAKIACVVTGGDGRWRETVERSGVFGCGSNSGVETPPILKKGPSMPLVTKQAPATPPPEINPAYCVTLPALSYANSIQNDHWVVDGNALVYRPDISNPHKVFPAGSDPLVYKFTVPVRSHYAITMDSLTTEVTDFNDCWLKFGNGITLRKIENGVQWPLRTGLTGSVKAYQNTARRIKAAYSVDGRYHSFETTHPLEPDTEYTFIIEGRSPRIKIFGLILFPCQGSNCWHETAHHEGYRFACNV